VRIKRNMQIKRIKRTMLIKRTMRTKSPSLCGACCLYRFDLERERLSLEKKFLSQPRPLQQAPTASRGRQGRLCEKTHVLYKMRKAELHLNCFYFSNAVNDWLRAQSPAAAVEMNGRPVKDEPDFICTGPLVRPRNTRFNCLKPCTDHDRKLSAEINNRSKDCPLDSLYNRSLLNPSMALIQ